MDGRAGYVFEVPRGGRDREAVSRVYQHSLAEGTEVTMGLRKQLERKQHKSNNAWRSPQPGWMSIKSGPLTHFIREKPIFWGGFTRYIGEYPTPTKCGLKIHILEKPTGPVTCLGCIAEGGA